MISVIVTVYNIERYLEPCLKSILDSTYRDFEVILVDDGSADGSGLICDRYAALDHRVRVIHKANAGVSEARNTGLEAARGEYITFVDGDDIVHPNMFAVLMDALQKGGSDASMVHGIQVPDEGHQSFVADKELGLNANRKVLSQRDVVRGLFGTSVDEFQYIVVWNKLYKSELVKDLRFKKTGSEDLEWSLQMALRTDKVVCVEETLYYWIQHQNSMTHKQMNPIQVDRMNSYMLCLEDIPTDKTAYRSWCLEKLYKVILHTRYNARGTDYAGQVKSIAKSLYKKTIGEYKRSEMDWKKKYGLLCFYHLPFVYKLFMDWCVARLKAKRAAHS